MKPRKHLEVQLALLQGRRRRVPPTVLHRATNCWSTTDHTGVPARQLLLRIITEDIQQDKEGVRGDWLDSGDRRFIIGTYYAVVLAWVMDYIGLSAMNAWVSADGAGKLFSWLIGSPWLVLVGLLLTWFITWVTVFKGVSGGIERACTFAIPTLWILSAILVIRGITLPGADTGSTGT